MLPPHYRMYLATLMGILLAGCMTKGDSPRIDETFDPMRQVPVNHFENWKPSTETVSGAADIRTSSVIPAAPAGFTRGKVHDLVELVDLGLRSNPTTKKAGKRHGPQLLGSGLLKVPGCRR